MRGKSNNEEKRIEIHMDAGRISAGGESAVERSVEVEK